jgi:hypothetical protein
MHLGLKDTGHLCPTEGEEQNCILGFMGKPEERHRLEENGTKGIILKWRFKKQNGITRVACTERRTDRSQGLHVSGCGEVQAVACTEHGTDRFNTV